MNTIQNVFQEKINNHEQLFVPYIMAGDGGIDHLGDQLLFLEQCGASAIEVGIPFSDPIADGPTIQAAGIRSLAAGTTLQQVFEQLEKGVNDRSTPILLMVYINVVFVYGIEEFAKKCKQAGVQGVIIPDVPLEEENIITPALKKYGVDWIRLVALTSSSDRIQQLANKAEGFMYAVSDTGTTGVRTEQRTDLLPFLRRVKELSPVPVLVGFGISTSKQVKALRPYCDGVIVGSAIVDLLHNNEREKIQTLFKSSELHNYQN